LNTYSKCSGNFVAAVSKIYLKLLESNWGLWSDSQ
jgi:hypothetical protein